MARKGFNNRYAYIVDYFFIRKKRSVKPKN